MAIGGFLGDIRNSDEKSRHIDYCLNIMGIRVWEDRCQLLARGFGGWIPIGPDWPLPIEVPDSEASLIAAGEDALRITAWQYAQEHPGTDISEVLSMRTPFQTALKQHHS